MLKVTYSCTGTSNHNISDKIIDISPLRRRVESEKPGEAGAIVFDGVSLEVPLSAFNDNDFSFANLDANGRYTFKIEAGFCESYTTIFNGMLDKSSVEHTSHSTARFDVLDQINALIDLENTDARQELSHYSGGSKYRFDIKHWGDASEAFGIYNYDTDISEYVDVDWALPIGSILKIGTALYFIIFSEIRHDTVTNSDYNYLRSYNTRPDTQILNQYVYYYSDFYFSKQITINDLGLVTHFDGYKIIPAIYGMQWYNPTVINRTNTSTYPIDLSYWEDLVLNCFGKHPLEAFKYMANMMRLYIYVDRSGNLILQDYHNLGVRATYTINADAVTDWSLKYLWSRRVDYVLVRQVDLYDEVDPDTWGEYPENLSTIPRNKMERDVFKLADNLGTIAQEYHNFYGVARQAAALQTPLTANNVTVEMLDEINWNSMDWFIEGMTMDLAGMKLDLDLVEL